MYEIPDDAPPFVQYLKKVPNKEYNFKHTVIQECPFPKNIVLWNLTDFAHVNWLHRTSYHHNKILAANKNISFVEFGANNFFNFKLPFTLKYIMYHEIHPPDMVQHISYNPFTGYTRIRVTLEEFEKDGIIHTRLHHTFWLHLSFFTRPFKKMISNYLEKWSEQLWKEDYAMMERRKKVLDAGFRDHPQDMKYKAAEGFFDLSK